MLKEVLDSNFSTEVEGKEGIVVVDFWAAWCGPCRMLTPIIEELASELQSKVEFVKLNVDDNPGVAQKYKIASIPTVMVFNNGVLSETLIGFRPKQELKTVIEKYI
jgi:thioredoxin 1